MPRQVVRSLIYQIIKSMPAYSYEFKYMDYTEGGNLLDDIHSIASVRNPNAYWLHDLFQHQYNMMTSATQISDIHALLSALSVYVDNVNEILAGAMTVPEYNWNKFNEDGSLASETGNGIIPQQIVIIDHFHGIWNEEDYRSIRKMILNAYQCGISLIMVSSRPVTSNLPAGQERAKEELLDDLEKKLLLDSDIMKMSAMGLDHLRWDLKGAFFSYRDTDVANGGSINRNFLPYQDSAEHRTFIAGIAKQFEDRIEVNAGFSDVVDRQNDWASKSADVEIEIPLGLNERGKQRWMSIGGPDAAHVMMAGSTGCGKSSYLHSIINTVLVNYSPDEVEIWLADYKSNEFMRYMTNTPANITFVSTNRTAEFSYAFIDRITAEYQRRSMEFGNLTSLKEYRAENPDKHMPHLLIIIDEFHVMANHCKEEIAYRDKLTGILREARAYGITLFLADQTCGIGLSGLAEDAKKQLTGRLAMRTTYDEYNAVFEITNAKEVIAGGAEKFEVIAQISTKEGKYYEKFHTIYTPPADRDAIARESIERYGTSENPTFILGDYRYHIDWSTIDRDRRPVRDRRRMGIPLYLGKPTNLQNYFRIELEDDYDQNLMFVGATDVLQGELILHTIESVRHQGDPYRIYVIAKENARLYIALEDALRQLSKEDRHINICTGPKSISSALNTLQNEIDDRQTQREFRDHIFVIWIGLDRLYREFERLPERPESDMNQNQTSRRTQAERNELQDMFVSFFGSDVPEQEEIDASAKKDVLPSEGDRYNENPVISSIINDGSAMGVLSIVSYSRASLIRKTKCAKLGSFSHRVALRMSKDDAMEFLESSRAILSSDGNIIDEKLAVYYNGMDTIRFGPYISRWEEQLD
ncbi:MAG: hypothetical protein IKF42_03080 [Mogibacterium sp.]|nr:hypothetical protein [Mogibacterium sp.]